MDTGAHSHVHNMAQMATSIANENTDEELKVKLSGRQWNARLERSNVRARYCYCCIVNWILILGSNTHYAYLV